VGSDQQDDAACTGQHPARPPCPLRDTCRRYAARIAYRPRTIYMARTVADGSNVIYATAPYHNGECTHYVPKARYRTTIYGK